MTLGVLLLLTQERHQLILQRLNEKEIVKLQELVELTHSSESTIRRDLVVLEEQNYIKRVHGGASLVKGTNQEQGFVEKSTKNLQEKKQIAEYAAALIQDGECIYLDAGTTTFQMIPFLASKEIIIVTNGLTHIDALLERGIKTYLLGGLIKSKTSALIGRGAIESMDKYRFDKSFMGVNGIHLQYGYTTPDPEEAIIKTKAIQLSREAYILADSSKFGDVTFAKVNDLQEATVITTEGDDELLSPYQTKTTIKVVTA